jgi:hypothetical protein
VGPLPYPPRMPFLTQSLHSLEHGLHTPPSTQTSLTLQSTPSFKFTSPLPLPHNTLKFPFVHAWDLPLLTHSLAFKECGLHSTNTRPPHSLAILTHTSPPFHSYALLSPRSHSTLTLFPFVNWLKPMEDGNILHEILQLPFSWYVGLLLAHTFPPFLAFSSSHHLLAISPHPRSLVPHWLL